VFAEENLAAQIRFGQKTQKQQQIVDPVDPSEKNRQAV